MGHGLLYDGYWDNDYPHGQGSLVLARNNLWLYEGEFKNGYFHNKGLLTFHNTKLLCEGPWENGLVEKYL